MTCDSTAAAERVSIGKHSLRVSVSGRGHPLLLLNGLGANLEMWAPLRAALPAKTIAVDMPGVGGSSTPRLPIPIPLLARLAAGVLDSLGIDEADVLGLSLGGVIAEQLAISHPERVRRLVLACTSWGLGMVPGRPNAWFHLLSPARYYLPGYYERHAGSMLGGRIARDAETARAYGASRRAHPPHLLGHFWQMWAGATWSTFPRLGAMRAPTLVLAGEDDPLIPVLNAKILARRIPGARLDIVPGGGHLLVVDSPDVAGSLIGEFLAQEDNPT